MFSSRLIHETIIGSPRDAKRGRLRKQCKLHCFNWVEFARRFADTCVEKTCNPINRRRTALRARDRNYPARRWLRTAVLVVAGLHTAVLIRVVSALYGQLFSAETLSRSLAWYALFICGIPYILCVLPALFLAALNQHLRVALTLSFLAVILTLILWHL